MSFFFSADAIEVLQAFLHLRDDRSEYILSPHCATLRLYGVIEIQPLRGCKKQSYIIRVIHFSALLSTSATLLRVCLSEAFYRSPLLF